MNNQFQAKNVEIKSSVIILNLENLNNIYFGTFLSTFYFGDFYNPLKPEIVNFRIKNCKYYLKMKNFERLYFSNLISYSSSGLIVNNVRVENNFLSLFLSNFSQFYFGNIISHSSNRHFSNLDRIGIKNNSNFIKQEKMKGESIIGEKFF